MTRHAAFVTGISGQDGRYLSAFLLDKGYDVAGLIRRTSRTPVPLDKRIHLFEGDLTDSASISRSIDEFQPTEVYNLGAQSHVAQSFKSPVSTADITGVGCTRVIEAINRHAPKAKFYQAGTSELFGGSDRPSLAFNESSPFHPRSPYACAKAYAHHATVHAREAHGLYAVNGILFNHESPIRGEEFVTRKITRAVGRIKAGTQGALKLGNTTPRRDWGFAGDYVRAMWLMLQQPAPNDYVVATGESHSVAEFATKAFNAAGLDAEEWIEYDAQMGRPAEVWNLRGNAGNIRSLGWEPSVDFDGLVNMMVASDIALAEKEKHYEHRDPSTCEAKT